MSAKREIEMKNGDQSRNLNEVREGDVEPNTGSRVETLISQDDDFIVFLDDKCRVCWWMTEAYGNYPENWGAVVNKAVLLESRSINRLDDKQMPHLRRLLGEGIARILSEKNSKHALAMLNEAETYLWARSSELARGWYMSATTITAFAGLLLGIALWLGRSQATAILGDSGFDIALGSCFGALGALISVYSRLGGLQVDSAAGSRTHYWEGAGRVLLGVAGAFLTVLAFKAGFILSGVIAPERESFAVAVICVIAGASERFVKSLVSQFEGSVTTSEPGRKPRPGTPEAMAREAADLVTTANEDSASSSPSRK